MIGTSKGISLANSRTCPSLVAARPLYPRPLAPGCIASGPRIPPSEDPRHAHGRAAVGPVNGQLCAHVVGHCPRTFGSGVRDERGLRARVRRCAEPLLSALFAPDNTAATTARRRSTARPSRANRARPKPGRFARQAIAADADARAAWRESAKTGRLE